MGSSTYFKTRLVCNASGLTCPALGEDLILLDQMDGDWQRWFLVTLSALDRMTFIVVQYLQYSATCFDQISDLLQALDN